MKLQGIVLTTAALATTSAFTQTPHTFVLTDNTLSYRMTHPVHTVDGTTHSAKGKGLCAAGVCNFLIAAPVKSFDSGDTNRDLHMLQVTRGAEFPVVSVRFQVPEADVDKPELSLDLDVTFAGNTFHYTHIPFHQDLRGTAHHITGTIPADITNFKIPAPSFLTVPIRNEIPVRVDTLWIPQ